MMKSVITLLVFFIGFTPCYSQLDQNLYAQTSEMNDHITRYEADKGSIRRFYSAGNGTGFQLAASAYYTPERRQRLTTLIQDNQAALSRMNFDKMSIYGKVDYI